MVEEQDKCSILDEECCSTVTIDLIKETNVPSNQDCLSNKDQYFIVSEQFETNNNEQELMFVDNVQNKSNVLIPSGQTIKRSHNSKPLQFKIINGTSQAKKAKTSPEFEHKDIPGRTRAAVTQCLEPGCNFVCNRIPQLRIHLEDVHNISQEKKEFYFSTEEEFEAWLGELQREARCTYMRRRGWQKNKKGSKTSCYYCHRGGAYTSMATKKQVKLQGSCKIGVECTSSMKVTMWPDLHTDKKVQVEAHLQHYGHNLDIGHTRITGQEKKDIANTFNQCNFGNFAKDFYNSQSKCGGELPLVLFLGNFSIYRNRKLSNGISRHKILDEIRGTLDPTETPKRLHFLSLQDIYNIEKKEGINNPKPKHEAGTTVQAWIEKMQTSEDNPVLLIKYQQEKPTQVCSCLSDDDFLLVMQTPLQSMMLRKYGPHQCVCIDITQGDITANSVKVDPSFYLISIEVVIPLQDSNDEIFPVAWFVSNRKDLPVVDIFLSQIKRNLSDLTLTPSYLMVPSIGIVGGSDWFEIWTKIFGSGPRKLICGWHIMTEWSRKVDHQTSSIKTLPLEGKRLLANVTTVILEPTISSFVNLVKDFHDDLKSSEVTFSFASHFEKYYLEQPESWARAYRTDSVNKAESRFEDFHRKLSRHIYHEGFKRKQLDVLIKTLMKHSRDKALNKLRSIYKNSSEMIVSRSTAAKHKLSSQLPSSFVTAQNGSHSWTVMSVIESIRAVEQTDGEAIRLKQVAVEYSVECTDVDRCPARLKCPYRCQECEICSHHFTCSCQPKNNIDALVNDGVVVLCEHCHLVRRYLSENGRTVASLFSSQEHSEVVVQVNTEKDSHAPDQFPLEPEAEDDDIPIIASAQNRLVVVVTEENTFDVIEQNKSDDDTENTFDFDVITDSRCPDLPNTSEICELITAEIAAGTT